MDFDYISYVLSKNYTDSYNGVSPPKNTYTTTFKNSTKINVQHNLNCKYPRILIIDEENDMLLCDVEYYSNNLVIIHSDIEITGTAIVIK